MHQTRRPIRLWSLAAFILLCGLVSLTTAEEAKPSPSNPESMNQSEDAVVVEDDGNETGEGAAKTDNAALNTSLPSDSKAKGALTSAIRIFRPTEEISADNAVPFPIDI